MIHPDINVFIQGQLAGLDDFQTLDKITEMIESFSRDIPEMLADMRINHLRRLSELYSRDELAKGAKLSPGRIRKLLER